MKKFEGILICTDLDGTLFKNDKTISPENIKAIEYFKKEGGIFTFVTGRMPFFVSDVYEMIKPNAPFGCINGAGLYDFMKKEYVWHADISDEVNELVRYIDEQMSGIGIQVNTFEHTYFCRENKIMKRFRELTGLPNLIAHYDEIEDPVSKIVFGCEFDEEILKIKELLDNHPLSEKFDFIRSEKNLYEILPKGTGKGVSVEKLCKYLNLDINKTIAVGDYNNDISMFSSAKIGIAVSNACEEAKKAADYITVSNEESAIAQVICDLEKGKYF